MYIRIIYTHLKTISTRFSRHFDNIKVLNKKLEEAMAVVNKFGMDARSITRTLENIKDPEQFEKALKTENVEKHGFVDRVVHRKDIKEEVGTLLSILLRKNSDIHLENLNETSETNIQTREAS